jgi:chromosome segregation ATPase
MGSGKDAANQSSMKTREIILILIAAAFGGVAIVTWSGEEAANQRAAKITKEANDARLKSVADINALNAKAAKDAAAFKKATDEAAAASAAKLAEGDAAKKKVEADLAKAKEDAGKAAVKAAELEKAKADAANRVNELTAELARLRDGSELKDAIAKQKKAEADLEAASTALRDANAKAATATARVAELEEENRRLREQTKGTDNASPNYRAL